MSSIDIYDPAVMDVMCKIEPNTTEYIMTVSLITSSAELSNSYI